MAEVNDDLSYCSTRNPGQDNVLKHPEVRGYSYRSYFLLAFQSVLPTLVNFVYMPLALLTFLCLLPDEPHRGNVIFTLLLYSGVANILQMTVGIKSAIMMSPSCVFISGTVLFLKYGPWESYSSGDLYAMGPSLRWQEYILRTSQLRGILIVNGVLTSLVCGILWYFPIELPPATIAATLISVSLSNIEQLLGKEETSIISILAFMLPLVFYIIDNLQIPFSSKKMNTFFRGALHIFEQFSILLSSIILVAVSMNLQNGEQSMLERAIGSHHWYSFNLPFKDFTLPQFTIDGAVFLPVLWAQFVSSYCCYQAISKEKDRHLKAMLVESALTVLTAGVGIAVPLVVDPTSIGLVQMTKVGNTEPSVIAGGLLILFSMSVKLVALFTYVSFPLLCGLNTFIYGQLLAKVLMEIKQDEKYSVSTVALPVVGGWLLSSVPIDELVPSISHGFIALLLTSPALVTFIISLIMTSAGKSSRNKETTDVHH